MSCTVRRIALSLRRVSAGSRQAGTSSIVLWIRVHPPLNLDPCDYFRSSAIGVAPRGHQALPLVPPRGGPATPARSAPPPSALATPAARKSAARGGAGPRVIGWFLFRLTTHLMSTRGQSLQAQQAVELTTQPIEPCVEHIVSESQGLINGNCDTKHVESVFD